MLQGAEGSAAARRHMQERECMIVTKDDPLAGRESATADDVDLDRVIGRSGSQLAMHDIDEPGIRLEDLLGSKRFVGCGHADETIETIHSGCGAALALTPLDMDPGKLSRVVLEPFEPVTIGIGYLKQHKTNDLRATDGCYSRPSANTAAHTTAWRAT